LRRISTNASVQDPEDPKKWQLSDPPPQGTSVGILPTVIKSLVQRRRAVKEKQGTATDPNAKSQLEIQQLALKLVANSMYGCLGFSNSRFMAMPLAELVTRKGRENLQKTVDIATKKLGLEVSPQIY
jgi:DNA polymerase alpha subunit A